MKSNSLQTRWYLPIMIAGVIFGQFPGGALLAGQQNNNVRPAIQWTRFDYQCENGMKIAVYLHDTTAKVRYLDHVYLMRQTPSADGNRYSDGKVVWWGRGREGFLQEDSPDGDGKILVKECNLDAAMSDEANPGTVSGTVTYLVRIVLPPTAVIQVQLQDVSLVDAPAKVLAEDKFALGDRQVPVPFTLKFDSGKINPKHTYGVSAHIFVNGELRFLNGQEYRVLTHGNPSKIEVVVKPAGGGKP